MKIFIWMSIVFLSFNVFAQRGEIVFSSAIEISPREIITAYDVVETKNISKNILERLKNIVVATDKTSVVLRDDLIRKLRAIEANYMLPSQMKLLRSGQPVSRMEVERKIKNHLLSNCGKCDFRININSVPKLMTSDWELDLNVDLNKQTVMVPVFSISSPNTKGWITAEVKKYQKVSVLNRDLKVGEIVSEDMLVQEDRLVTNPNIITPDNSVVGMQAVKFIPAGRALNYSDFKKEVVLKRGQIVKALAGQDNFEISISALAEESGAVGDVIKVKNAESNKVLSARIEDRSTVRIE